MDFSLKSGLLIATVTLQFFALAGCEKSGGSNQPVDAQTDIIPDPKSLTPNSMWLSASGGSSAIFDTNSQDSKLALKVVLTDNRLAQGQGTETKVQSSEWASLVFSISKPDGLDDKVVISFNQSALSKHELKSEDALIYYETRAGVKTNTRSKIEYYIAGMTKNHGEKVSVIFNESPIDPTSGQFTGKVSGTFMGELCAVGPRQSDQCDDEGAVHIKLRGAFNMVEAPTFVTPLVPPTPIDFGDQGSALQPIFLGASTPIYKNALSVKNTSYYKFTGKKDLKYRISAAALSSFGAPLALALPQLQVDEVGSDGIVIAPSTRCSTGNQVNCILLSHTGQNTPNLGLSNAGTDFVIKVTKPSGIYQEGVFVELKIVDVTAYSSSLSENPTLTGTEVLGTTPEVNAGNIDKLSWFTASSNTVEPMIYRIGINETTNNNMQLLAFVIPSGSSPPKTEVELANSSNLVCAPVSTGDPGNIFSRCDIAVQSGQKMVVTAVTNKESLPGLGTAFRYTVEPISTADAFPVENIGSFDNPIDVTEQHSVVNGQVGAGTSYYLLLTQPDKTYTVRVHAPKWPLYVGVGDRATKTTNTYCAEQNEEDDYVCTFVATTSQTLVWVKQNSVARIGMPFALSYVESGVAYVPEVKLGSYKDLTTYTDEFEYAGGQANPEIRYVLKVSQGAIYTVAIIPKSKTTLRLDVIDGVSSEVLCTQRPAPNISAQCVFGATSGYVVVRVFTAVPGGGAFNLKLSNGGDFFPIVPNKSSITLDTLSSTMTNKMSVGVWTSNVHQFVPVANKEYTFTLSPLTGAAQISIFQHPYRYNLRCVRDVTELASESFFTNWLLQSGLSRNSCTIKIGNNVNPLFVVVSPELKTQGVWYSMDIAVQ